MRLPSVLFVFIAICTWAQDRSPYIAHHSDEINTIQFSPDGAYVITGGWDSKTLVHRADSSAELVQTLHDNRGAINELYFSRDGKKMISGGQDGLLRIYSFDSANYEPLELDTSMNLDVQINRLIYGPGMRMIFSGGDDGVFTSYDLVKQKVRTINVNRPIAAMAVAVDRMSYFIALEGDATIHQFDIFGKELKTFTGHSNDITDILVSIDRKTIISSSKDKTVKIWNIAKGEEETSWQNHTWAVTDIDIDPFGQYLVSGGLDGVVNFYDLKSKTLIDSFHLTDNKINAVSWSPDNTKIAAAAHPEGITNPSGYFILPTNLKARKVVLAKPIDLAELRAKNAERELQKEWDKALKEEDKKQEAEEKNSSSSSKKNSNAKKKNKKTIDKSEQVEITIEDDE